MNTPDNPQPDPPFTPPDVDDPDLEYVQTVSTEAFTQRIEQAESE